MVRTGPRPAHRRGTAGATYARFRERHTNGATHCPRCGVALVRDAACQHPSHQKIGYCPTHPAYPTLEHLTPLVDGGSKLDGANAAVLCYRCNAQGGGRRAAAGHFKPKTSRRW